MVMHYFHTEEEIAQQTITRAGETKMGEAITLVTNIAQIESSPASYIILGIAEDYGVQANGGKSGTRNAYTSFLQRFLNVQVNEFNDPEKVILGGYIKVVKSSSQNTDSLSKITENVDLVVYKVIQRIVLAGKIPVVVGGGHNNAFGILKGVSLARKKAINCINIDAHTDLRTADGRHSGNGFSYALAEGYLSKYTVFGLHKNYTPQYIFDQFSTDTRVTFYFFEDMLLANDQVSTFAKAQHRIATDAFGLEIDCDAIAHLPASASTPSGFTLELIRWYLQKAGTDPNCCYLHICEASPAVDSCYDVGKALSYLVTDFIRS